MAIEVRDVDKTFRIPEHRVDSFKERAAHPFTRMEYRDLRALRDISFDVHQGEFFGIVGRNGSGKSTLLKILASIYGADGGTVRMAGRLAPFIELGVGFNVELTARENALLNGVLLGLPMAEARRRLEAVLEFAELDDFLELKLKNYSSGMLVRLAFAIMVQADADIMLIDEVLAVGDAGFAQKCMDVFHEKREAGKTIVLVTHDMAMVQSLCDRAMLLHDGELKFIGDPVGCAQRYYRLNHGIARHVSDEELERQVNASIVHDAVRVVRAGLTDDEGRHAANVEQGEPLRLEIVLETRRELESPRFVMHVLTEDGTVVFEFTQEPDEGRLAAGRRFRLAGEVENPLVPGRYILDLWVGQQHELGSDVQGIRLLHFLVYGTSARHGIVSVDTRLAIEPEAEV